MSWPIFFTVVEVLWIAVLVPWIVLEKRSPTATLAWIFGLMSLPVVGALVYLLIGPRRLERKKSRLLAARSSVTARDAGRTIEDCAWLQGLDPGAVALMKVAAKLDGLLPMRAEHARVLEGGDETYDAILSAIAAATHHVHCEYYIFRDDESGRRFIEALKAKAKAGVEVRLLVDAVGASFSEDTEAELEDARVQLVYFNPAFSGRIGQRLFNFRTHRKLVIVDGVVGFTGGINVTDDHSERVRGKAAWRDTHVELRGEVVHGLQRTFFENWVFASGEERSGKQLDAYFPVPTAEGRHIVQVVASGPDDASRAIEAFYVAAISTAQKRVWLTTPYFVPNEPLHRAIYLAALRGVDVRLLLPNRTDSKMVDLAGASFHDQLLHAGVRIYVYQPSMLHAKTAVIDELGIVGSANLDDRSLRLNFETIVACYGGPVVASLVRLFEKDHEVSKLKMRLEEKKPFSHRLMSALARLLAPQL